MLDMPAFSQVTAVKLVGNLDVKHEDANAKTPTQVVGKCQLSGLSVSEFLEPQRDAFKAAMAETSGAQKHQVVINDVSATSSRRRRLRRQLSNGLVVEFAIQFENENPSADSAPEPQTLAPELIAVITVSCILGVIAVGAAIILFVIRKKNTKNARVGITNKNHLVLVENGKQSSKQNSTPGPKSTTIEMPKKHSSGSIVRKFSGSMNGPN